MSFQGTRARPPRRSAAALSVAVAVGRAAPPPPPPLPPPLPSPRLAGAQGQARRDHRRQPLRDRRHRQGDRDLEVVQRARRPPAVHGVGEARDVDHPHQHADGGNDLGGWRGGRWVGGGWAVGGRWVGGEWEVVGRRARPRPAPRAAPATVVQPPPLPHFPTTSPALLRSSPNSSNFCLSGDGSSPGAGPARASRTRPTAVDRPVATTTPLPRPAVMTVPLNSMLVMSWATHAPPPGGAGTGSADLATDSDSPVSSAWSERSAPPAAASTRTSAGTCR